MCDKNALPQTGAALGGGRGGGELPPMIFVCLLVCLFCLSAQSRTVTMMMIIPLPHYDNNFATKNFGRTKKNVSESPPPPPPERLFLFRAGPQCSARHFAILPPPPPPQANTTTPSRTQTYLFDFRAKVRRDSLRGGGGGALTSQLGRGVPLGGSKPDPVSNRSAHKNIHSVTIYRTNTFICIPCCNIAHLEYIPCPIVVYSKKKWNTCNSKSVAPRTHRRWCRDRGPVINIVGGNPAGKSCMGSNPVINGVARQ